MQLKLFSKGKAAKVVKLPMANQNPQAVVTLPTR